jgi:hypothetical protein
MGYAVPPGTIVATQAWSMHRDTSIFPSPDTFLPERWIESSTNAAELFRMSQHMMPFGTGTRICGGQNFALAMMRTVIAAVVRNFDVVAPPETTEKSMEIKDSFVRGRLHATFAVVPLFICILIIIGHLPRCDGVQTQLCSSSKIRALPILRVAVLSMFSVSSPVDHGLLSSVSCLFVCSRFFWITLHLHAFLSLSCLYSAVQSLAFNLFSSSTRNPRSFISTGPITPHVT